MMSWDVYGIWWISFAGLYEVSYGILRMTFTWSFLCSFVVKKVGWSSEIIRDQATVNPNPPGFVWKLTMIQCNLVGFDVLVYGILCDYYRNWDPDVLWGCIMMLYDFMQFPMGFDGICLSYFRSSMVQAWCFGSFRGVGIDSWSLMNVILGPHLQWKHDSDVPRTRDDGNSSINIRNGPCSTSLVYHSTELSKAKTHIVV